MINFCIAGLQYNCKLGCVYYIRVHNYIRDFLVLVQVMICRYWRAWNSCGHCWRSRQISAYTWQLMLRGWKHTWMVSVLSTCGSMSLFHVESHRLLTGLSLLTVSHFMLTLIYQCTSLCAVARLTVFHITWVSVAGDVSRCVRIYGQLFGVRKQLFAGHLFADNYSQDFFHRQCCPRRQLFARQLCARAISRSTVRCQLVGVSVIQAYYTGHVYM